MMLSKRLGISVVLLIILLCGAAGCKVKDSSSANDSGSSSQLITPAPDNSGELTGIELEIIESPERSTMSGVLYSVPENLEDLFATAKCVVFGRVENVEEYNLIKKYSDGNIKERAFSGITFHVDKCYGVNSMPDTISILYEPCITHDYGESFPDINEGEEYFFFINSTAKLYSDEIFAPLTEKFPYVVFSCPESIIESMGNGFNGAYLYALKDEAYTADLYNRYEKQVSKKSIIQLIKKHTDDFRGLSPIEFTLEKDYGTSLSDAIDQN